MTKTYLLLDAELENEAHATCLVEKEEYEGNGYAPKDYFAQAKTAKVIGEVDIDGEEKVLTHMASCYVEE